MESATHKSCSSVHAYWAKIQSQFSQKWERDIKKSYSKLSAEIWPVESLYIFLPTVSYVFIFFFHNS